MAELIHGEILKRVKEGIVALALPGIQPDEIRIRRNPWYLREGAKEWHTGITIHPEPEIEGVGTNERDDIGYGVGVTCIAATDSGQDINIEKIPTWRRKIRSRFIHQRLANMDLDGSNQITCTEEDRGLNTPIDDRYEISSQLLRFWIRESRG